MNVCFFIKMENLEKKWLSCFLFQIYWYLCSRVAGFEGAALKDGVRAKGNSLMPGGFYAQVGQDLTEGTEHNVEGGDISVYHSQK